MKMPKADIVRFRDPLYGEIEFASPIAELIATPAVQRLKRIRLSNIDSIDMPAIAGVSRFEHVLGVCHLAHLVGVPDISEVDAATLRAACLLHDIAITPFGHLLEEALRYSGTEYSHEDKLASLFAGADDEIGGLELQLFEGAQAGVATWAREFFGPGFQKQLSEIVTSILGANRWGKLVAGAIDLDNIDNVVRLAHRIGLPFSPHLPSELTGSIQAVSEVGVVWSERSIPLIEEWVHLRRDLYGCLMFARRDFVAKSMMTVAIVEGRMNGQLGVAGYEWTLTDDELIQRLARPDIASVVDVSQMRRVGEIISSWQLGRLWPSTPMLWVKEAMPDRPRVWAFGQHCSDVIERRCYAHGIPDKRNRRIEFVVERVGTMSLGERSSGWLLGIISPKRTPFRRVEIKAIADLASSFFDAEVRSMDSEAFADEPMELAL